MYQADDRLVRRHAGRDEDRQNHGEPGELLTATRAKKEGDPERDSRERITEVVDQISEERDRAGEDEDDHLRRRGNPEHSETERDRLDALARSNDRAIDEPVRVAMLAVAVTMLVAVLAHLDARLAVSNGPRSAGQKQMAVRFAARMAVDVVSVPMQDASTRSAHRPTT
jgi:formiminotetrahydrofolate cyclodeaminase